MNKYHCLPLLAFSILILVSSIFLPANLAVSNLSSLQSATNPPKNSRIDELVRQLVAAPSAARCQAIVAENSELVSPQLIEALTQFKKINPIASDEKPDKVEWLNRLLLGLSQRIGHQKGIAVSISFLGYINRRSSRYDVALAYYDFSLSIFQTLGEKSWMDRLHRYIGAVHSAQQNYPEALKHFSEEYRLAKEVGESYYIALALYNQGTAYEEMGLPNEAIARYQASYDLGEKTSTVPSEGDLPRLMADTMMRLGNSHFGNGQLDQAINIYKKEVARLRQKNDPRSLASMLNSLGYAYLESENWNQTGSSEEALKASSESLEIAKKLNSQNLIAQSNRVLGLIHSSRKNFPQAFEAIEETKQIAEKLKDESLLQKAYRAEGIANYAALRPQQARAAFDKAIHQIEKRRAAIPVSLNVGPTPLGYQYSCYGWMTALLVSQGQIEDALSYAERSKSRFLFNALSNPDGKSNQFATPAYLQEQQRLIGQILNIEMQIAREEYAEQPATVRVTELTSQLQQTKEALGLVKGRIETELDAIANRWPQDSEFNSSDLAALLPDEQTALLQFALSEEQVFLFVATKAGERTELRAYPLGLRRYAISAGVSDFRKLIINRDQTEEIDRTARLWYDKLFASAQAQLHNKRRLVIVPDGLLWEMPFQSLKLPDGRFLIEQSAISYAPSFNVLRQMSQQPALAQNSLPSAKLLALGNPSLSAQKMLVLPGGLMDQTLGPLPDAEKQVNWIRKNYGLQKSTVLIRELATESRFKTLAPEYDILHIAAHGLYNDLEPMRSSIVLSQTGKSGFEDGFLEAREIARLKLKARMAILSACETGRGQVRDGEGIIGLPYALFVAGCPTTIVSQWNVDAESTADLMIALHTNLNQRKTHLSKAEALQKAAVSLITSKNDRFSHPFFWAGFIAFGKAD